MWCSGTKGQHELDEVEVSMRTDTVNLALIANREARLCKAQGTASVDVNL